MKKNIHCFVRWFLFCFILLLSKQSFCQKSEIWIPKLHNLFPHIPRGYQNSKNANLKSTSYRLSKANPYISFKAVSLLDEKTVVMAKLITGFNGNDVAKVFEADFFPLFLEKRLVSKSDAQALDFAFRSKAGSIPYGPLGATALIAVFSHDKITIAHVGDCVAFLCSRNGVFPLTKQHTYDNDDELLRLCGCRYYLLDEGIPVTRAFGFDEKFKWDLMPIPEINEISINDNDTFLILATNEFMCLSPDEIHMITQSASTPEEVSNLLMDSVKKAHNGTLRSLDDLEFMVIKLVKQSSRIDRKNLKKIELSMEKLLEDFKQGIININSFCEKYQNLCKNVYLYMNNKQKSFLCYETNDLFYAILRLGFENFCYAKNFLPTFTQAIDVFNCFYKIILFLNSRSDLLSYFPNQQRLYIQYWAEETEQYLTLQQYLNLKISFNINNVNVFGK